MKKLTAQQLQRELNIRGWSFAWMHDGNHMQFKKVGEPKLITIPVHGSRPIRPGLLRKILRDAGISPSELEEWLRDARPTSEASINWLN